MEGLLARAGFQVDSAEYGENFGTTVICSRR